MMIFYCHWLAESEEDVYRQLDAFELEGKYGQRNLRAFQSFVAPLDPLKKFVNPFLQNLILFSLMP